MALTSYFHKEPLVFRILVGVLLAPTQKTLGIIDHIFDSLA